MGLKLRYRDDRCRTLAGKPPRAHVAAKRAGLDRRWSARQLRRMRIFEVASFTLMCVTIAGASLSPVLLPGRVSPVVMLVMPAAIMAVVIVALTPLMRPLAWKLHRAGLLSLGLCPACGYPIAELEPEEDQCRVCPECGCAWKMEA